MRLLDVLAFLPLVFASRNGKFCPVSGSYNTQMNGIHGYPVDLFEPEALATWTQREASTLDENLAFFPKQMNSLFNCFNYERGGVVFRNCSTLTTCPVKDHHFQAALSRNSGNSSHSLCHLRDTLTNPDTTINVIILGGSMTMGLGTGGCCCTGDVDSKCKSLVNVTCPQLSETGKFCTWSAAFTYWLQGLGRARVNFLNLAVGGYTSDVMADMLYRKLNDNNIATLTSNDIVFVDHSVNDAVSFTKSKGQRDKMKLGLSQLLVKLLHKSTEHSWPTIILLEQWPYPTVYQTLNKDQWDYSNTYEEVANIFQIPIWSSRAAVTLNITDKTSITLAQEHLLYKKAFFTPHHPAWFVHLFSADLFASLFQWEMRQCFLSGGAAPHSRPRDTMTSQYIPAIDAAARLDFCDPKVPLQLDVDAESLMVHHNGIGSFESNPPGRWQLVEDRPHKFGWVITSYVEPASLIFHAPSNGTAPPAGVFRALTIHYLRTHHNAGMAEVYSCGGKVGVLDALWTDHLTNRVSMPASAHFTLFPCPPESTKPLLEIKHIKAPRSTVESDNQARDAEKVKIITVQICAFEQGNYRRE